MNDRRLRIVGLTRVFAIVLTSAGLLPSAVAGTVIVVTSTDDDTTVNGNCTLREAVIAANTDSAVDACPAGSGTDVIVVPAGVYTFTLAGTNEYGDLDLYSDLSIVGAGPNATTIDANGLDRVFEIYSSAQVRLIGMTLTGGDSNGIAGGSIRIAGSATAELVRVRVTGTVGDASSAIYVLSGSSLDIVSSRIDENEGRGLYLQSATSVSIRDSSISGNRASLGGAGIENSGHLVVVNSTVSGNIAGTGGGGILNGGTLGLYGVTVADNTAGADGSFGDGGGVHITGTGSAVVTNSLIAGNRDLFDTAHPDCFGAIHSLGYNLIQDTTGCTITGLQGGNLYGMPALLAPLAGNGGGTLTHRLLPGSPAIDAGHPTGCVDASLDTLATDQRGFLRNGRCDIGAYEANSPGRDRIHRDGFDFD